MNIKTIITAKVTFIYYFIFVCISFFLASYLVVAKEIPQATVGYVNALAVFGFVIVLICFGQLADSRFGNTKMLITGFLTSSILMALMYFTSGNISLVVYVLLIVNFLSLLPIVDGLILKLESGYTKIRMYGSLGAAVSYFLCSTILDGAQYHLIILINVTLMVIAFLGMLVYQNNNQSSTVTDNQVISESLFNRKSIREVLFNKHLLPIYIITFCTYGLLGGDDAYSYLYETQEVKLTGTVIGIVGFFSILIEVFGMKYYEQLMGKIKYQYLILVSIIVLIVSNCLKYFSYTSKPTIIVSNLILGVFVVLIVPTVVNVIHQTLKQNQLNTGLSMFQVFIKLGAAFFGFLTSIVYSSNQSYHGIYMLYIVVLVFTLIFYIFFIKVELKKQSAKRKVKSK